MTLLCQIKEPRSNHTPGATCAPRAQILVANTLLQQREQGFWEEWMILDKEEMYKIKPESKEMI